MSEAEWDEAQIVSALNYLQNLHIQLRNLRHAMSRVVHPMLIMQSSPEVLYSQFSQVATDTSNDIQEFVKLIEGDRSQEILNKARSSRVENAQGIRGWMATERPDWLELQNEDMHLDPAGGQETAPPKADPVDGASSTSKQN